MQIVIIFKREEEREREKALAKVNLDKSISREYILFSMSLLHYLEEFFKERLNRSTVSIVLDYSVETRIHQTRKLEFQDLPGSSFRAVREPAQYSSSSMLVFINLSDSCRVIKCNPITRAYRCISIN